MTQIREPPEFPGRFTFRMLLVKVAQEKALPFDPLVPNAVTIAAMKEARRGKLEAVTLDQLQAVLDADD